MKKLFRKIMRLFGPSEETVNRFLSFNPHSFSPEEIALCMKMPRFLSRFCCDMAVREGKFKKNDDGSYGLSGDA